MTYKVRWLKEAEKDLQSIRDYLDKEAPNQATQIVTEIYNKAMALCNFPNGKGQVYIGKPEYRRLIILSNYKVIYKVLNKNKIVEIQYIRHTSQDNII